MALDRFRKAIKRLAEEPSLRYYGLYPYKIAQISVVNGATLMDLISEAEGMPDLTGIQWLMPIGATSFDGIANNTTLRILVGFIEGDPTKPYALPNFLSGMVDNLIQSTGDYTHNVYGNHETNTIATDATDGNIIETATNTNPFATGGNILMTATRKIRMDPTEDVVIASGTRNVARNGESVTLNLTAHVVDPLSGQLPVVFTVKTATVNGGTNKLKVP